MASAMAVGTRNGASPAIPAGFEKILHLGSNLTFGQTCNLIFLMSVLALVTKYHNEL